MTSHDTIILLVVVYHAAIGEDPRGLLAVAPEKSFILKAHDLAGASSICTNSAIPRLVTVENLAAL